MGHPDHDPAPTVVLEARENFADWFAKTNPTGEELFDYMVSHSYVNLKFYIECATGYDAV